MKMIYTIIGLVVIGFIFYIIRERNKSSAVKLPRQQVKDSSGLKNVDSNSNPFQDLRNLALGATQEQIGVEFPLDQTKIYGVVMDWDLGEGIATLVAFVSGDASVYLSSGGGVIGGSQHDNVRNAAVAFINKAETYLNLAVKADNTSLPVRNGVKFYFLTNKGKFVGQEAVKNFDNNSSQWLDLFEEANKLMTEIRIIADMK